MINYDDLAVLLMRLSSVLSLLNITDDMKRLAVGRRLSCECCSPRHGARRFETPFTCRTGAKILLIAENFFS